MEQKWKNILIIVGAGVIFYLFTNTPLYTQIVGLGPNDTVLDFVRAPTKTKVQYLMAPECLSAELADFISINGLEDVVDKLFYYKLRTAIGSEEIGTLYYNCALSVARYKGFKGN